MPATAAMTAAELAEAFPGAALYEDAELTRALVERRAPCVASGPGDLERVPEAEPGAVRQR